MILSIIIPTHNSSEFILPCIESIIENIDFELFNIIVIDNNSEDNTVKLINQKFPNVITSINRENFGYSYSVNKGVERSNSEFICVLNPDTVICNNIFKILISHLRANKNVGCIGPKIFNVDDTFQFSCRRNFPSPYYFMFKFLMLDRRFPHSRIFNSYNMGGVSVNQVLHVN